ncbi:homoserine O-succinyltransferase MetA [Granulosicoccus antarcticus]|uniref:Homoserine O-succinyltransferase n=1 Tax=Granulosicoccus antarcticus IMCC3135 TaxID=1192854 RepID=A0A2Z2NMZ4_9GAMM|nr:homoserine O-succinyltransferase [Granulosicoccus antarcticus]ASJ71098.1 Homoserine O-succinyltransferase [Granulosicoccus antarcticus IMCC3135]
MPLVAHNDLPSFERLREEGYRILSPERAREQNIRALHIGLLNMMPDAALEATERQFFRLVGSSNPISQFCIHPFTLDEIPRGEAAKQHISRYYEPFAKIQELGLDALIISGANVTNADLSEEIFWNPLLKVIDWADANVTSTLCSCLASHAVLLARYNIRRRSLPKKCWGVFEHDVVRKDHPLVQDINTRLFVPHSRFNEITEQQLTEAGLHVLISGEEPGVQLAVSPDGFRSLFMQGHPEYDSVSLLKEYKRDVGGFVSGQLPAYPPIPRHYFDRYNKALFDEYKERVHQMILARAESGITSESAPQHATPRFPENLALDRLTNTWHDSGEALVGNWIGLVYQVTNRLRELPFMDGVDPDDPLGWLAGDVSRLT